MAPSNILACRASSTISSIMGNITGIVKEHLQTRFPAGYIKNVIINTTQASTNMADNGDNVFNKTLPMMSLRPNFDINADNLFGSLPYWHNAWEHIYKNPRYNYRGVFFNDQDGYYIYSIPDRISFSFDVKVMVSSYMQKIDLVNFIRQVYNINGYYYLNGIPLETQVPNLFISILMQQMGTDVNNPDSLQKFNDYLKQFSSGYLNPKKNLSNGNTMYSYRYFSNILCKMSDLNVDDTDKVGQIDNNSTVSFRFTTELWVPANFILETTALEAPPTNLQQDPLLTTDTGFSISFTGRIAPAQTMGNLSLLINQSYITDVNVAVDELDITDLFNSQVSGVIGYNIDTSIDNWSMFDIIVTQDSKQLVKDTDFTFDWNTLTLRTINPLYNMTYNVSIYVDLRKLNETWDAMTSIIDSTIITRHVSDPTGNTIDISTIRE
jgi:hypothetical protein